MFRCPRNRGNFMVWVRERIQTSKSGPAPSRRSRSVWSTDGLGRQRGASLMTMSLERRLWPVTLIGEPARYFAIILLDLRLLDPIAGRGVQGVRQKTCLRIIFHANEVL